MRERVDRKGGHLTPWVKINKATVQLCLPSRPQPTTAPAAAAAPVTPPATR